jgi:hypothetical protein
MWVHEHIDHPALAHPLIKVWTVTAFDAQPLQRDRWAIVFPSWPTLIGRSELPRDHASPLRAVA